MPDNKIDLINNYRLKVKSANKELPKKEAFKDLLNRLYSGDKEIEKIIDKITQGSESTVLNIPRKDIFHKGSADTLYNKIIIEFENNLKVTLKHAKEQLAGYLLGQFNSGEGYNFTLIVTDCITWKIFAPDVSQIENLENLNEDNLKLNEVESASFTLKEDNSEDFYYWIDRFLFKEQKQRATLKQIKESFGYQSNVFIESFRELTEQFYNLKKYGEVQVSFEQWSRFLSIAYGSFDANDNNFLIHTYLSIFSKMLAYAVVSNNEYINEDELNGIINGNIFNKFNIQNFVDNDFFHWVGAQRNFRALKKVFRLLAQEISLYDLHNVDEDILKGVYQELIDLDTRHAMGEYYTPDWLCERIVKEFDFNTTDKILDPACGSGSFLRAAIHRIKELNPKVTVEELNNNIYGIDIHPLSVQIAKTTLLLALGKDITKAKKPIHLNIILANTLLTPEGVMTLFSGEIKIQIDKQKLYLNSKVFEDVSLFDEAIELCEDLAEHSIHKKKETKQTLENNLKQRLKNITISNSLITSFYKIYETFKHVKETGRDSIWKFIIQNLYKPYFLHQKFDYVIGNPPWFTFNSIKNEEYQNQLNLLADKYKIKPTRIANFPHLEIAAIFLAHCSNYFLNDNGKLCFVLPRSFFNADHHENTRSGGAIGFHLTKIWDLISISPLFRIPSCVMFAERAVVFRTIPASGINGISFSGYLPFHNCNLTSIFTKLNETPTTWYYIKQGKFSALSVRNAKTQNKVNPYKQLFKQGATIVPRPFYFIQLDQETPPDWEDRIINIKTNDDVQIDAKVPWKGLNFAGKIESNFIFRTALAKNILPFALHKPVLVSLPILIIKDEVNRKNIRLYSAKKILEEGFRDASRWFQNAERIWGILRTEKSRNMESYDRIDYHKGLSDQNLNAPYLVLYNASAKDANATVVKRFDMDLEFIAESKEYYFNTDKLNEAYYLTAILNSSVPNLQMKDFQTKGLFGARDIHKKILDIYFPRYNEDDKIHRQLAELSHDSHRKVSEFLKGLNPEFKIEGIHLGNIRLAIKDHLSNEIKVIDELVKKILI